MRSRISLCSLALASVVFGMSAGTGCFKNDCEDAVERFDAKVDDECGHDDLRRSKPEGEESDAPCSEADGNFMQCEVTCYEEAECGFDVLELSVNVQECVDACIDQAAEASS